MTLAPVITFTILLALALQWLFVTSRTWRLSRRVPVLAAATVAAPLITSIADFTLDHIMATR